MNRNERRLPKRLFRLTMFSVLLCSMLISTAPVLAGDPDGVNGFSMRLKWKEFSSEDDGGTSNLVGGQTEAAVSVSEQPRNVRRHQVDFLALSWVPFQYWVWFWIR